MPLRRTIRARSRRLHRVRRDIPDRLVYTRWDSVNRERVVVKRYLSRVQASREARVMQSYGESPYLVCFRRFFTRRRKGYVIMERVNGRTLRTVIRTHGPLRPHKVIAIALNILSGLDTLHAAGYVHGDLHSGNVIVMDFFAAMTKIIDLQHAVRKNSMGKARARRKLRRPPAMLAPETRRRTIDERYDIYGVGFMCACMLRGRELLRRPKIPRSLSEGAEVWRVVKKATHWRPSQRYGSAVEMMEALRLAGESVTAAETKSTTAHGPLMHS